MRVAISGAGVAGPTLAYWLAQAGHTPTLVEAAPAVRTGGYMIDFWGVGYDVAERMGVIGEVRQAGYALQEVVYLDSAGRRAASISAETMSRELGDRFTSLARGDLAAVLWRAAAAAGSETLFGQSIAVIDDTGQSVRIQLSGGDWRAFDLLVGADGLHSGVRGLTFGPESAFERDLGYYVAAFEREGYRPRDELAYVSYGVAGRQISRFALRGDRTMFLLVFAAERLDGQAPPPSAPARKEALRRVFAGCKWEWPAIERELEAVDELYFDRVSQVALPAWTKGRVALVGDAAACVSLVAGEGTGLGMTEAYVLAGELARNPDHRVAFEAYESRLKSFIARKQEGARRFAGSFTPRTAIGVWLRNQATRLMAIPGLPGLLIGAQMRDDIALPDYAGDFASAGATAAPCM